MSWPALGSHRAPSSVPYGWSPPAWRRQSTRFTAHSSRRQDSRNDLAPCRMALPFVSAGAHAPHFDETPGPMATRGSSHSASSLMLPRFPMLLLGDCASTATTSCASSSTCAFPSITWPNATCECPSSSRKSPVVSALKLAEMPLLSSAPAFRPAANSPTIFSTRSS